MPIQGKSAQPEPASNPYAPPGPPPLVFETFQGINTSTSRAGVKDEEMWWCDSLFPIGPRMLRTMYGVGEPLFSILDTLDPDTEIVVFDFANIGTTPYCIVFTSIGSIYAVNTVTRIAVQIAPFGTIANPIYAAMTQYGSQYVLIVSSQSNGYFIWDGTTFYKPGDAWPPGGTVPLGIRGTAIEIYAGRIWIAENATITFSVAGSLVDFSSANGGGEFTSSDSFLRIAFTALRQSNGFLYLIGDSSVNYISGVQTSAGSPPVTTFTNQNADPEVGSPWPGSVDVFGRNIIFANAWGVHVSYGAAVSKISEPLDGIYNSIMNFGGFMPSAAKAIIFGKRVWMLLLPIVDPFSGQQVTKLLVWNGRVWFAASQDVNLIFIQHQELASILTAWGTDGTTIWPLFINPSTTLTKVVMTKLWDAPGGYEFTKAAARLFGLLQYFTDVDNTIRVRIDSESSSKNYSVQTTTLGITWINDLGNTITWTNGSFQPITWVSINGGISSFLPIAIAQQGRLTGMTFSTACPDLALISMKLQDEIVAGRY